LICWSHVGTRSRLVFLRSSSFCEKKLLKKMNQWKIKVKKNHDMNSKSKKKTLNRQKRQLNAGDKKIIRKVTAPGVFS
jgi:hypothetical protein